jgi:hypothetical protein
MTERKPLTKAQHDAIGTALIMYPQGFVIDAHRVADRMVCDGLVKRGDLVAVAGVDGGYQASQGRVAAQRVQAAKDSEAATWN